MQKVVEVIREFVQSQWTLGELHGIDHWDRVYQNGQKLLSQDVNPLVVALFAYLHDSCRMNDGEDMESGDGSSTKDRSVALQSHDPFLEEQ